MKLRITVHKNDLEKATAIANPIEVAMKRVYTGASSVGADDDVVYLIIENKVYKEESTYRIQQFLNRWYTGGKEFMLSYVPFSFEIELVEQKGFDGAKVKEILGL